MCNYSFDKELRETLLRYMQYEKFNRHVKPDGNNQICEKLSVETNMPKKFKNFCYILSKNIEEACITMNSLPQKSGLCEPLNYWVYDTLIKNELIKDEEDISKSEIINELPKLWAYYNCMQNCKLNKYNMSVTDFKYMKELYDYTNHYLTIDENKSIIDAIGCKERYCSYINKVDKIYNTVKGLCAFSSGKPYCSLFSEIRQDNIPSVYLKLYRCSNTDIDDSLVQDEKIFTKPLLPDPQDESITASDSEISLSPNQLSPKGSFQDAPEDPSSNSSVNVGLSTFGMSLVPLFLIYKFTPGGNFLRRIINQKIGTNYITGEIPSGDWFSISRAHQNDIQENRKFNVLYQNMEKK
ncbi:PIR protein [Plasmodium vivax]|uniref:VIR protein n=1 Tax=Plasmodium vivax TaxID=5855 RepID=A0A565A4B3_PLAVI|nr:PIR protein [Plasmodium vivax]